MAVVILLWLIPEKVRDSIFIMIKFITIPIKVEYHYYWEGSCTLLKSKNLSINDGINLVKVLLGKSKYSDINFEESIYYKDENGTIYRVEDGSGSIFFFEIKYDDQENRSVN